MFHTHTQQLLDPKLYNLDNSRMKFENALLWRRYLFHYILLFPTKLNLAHELI